MSDKKEKGKSLRWMVTMLMLLMAAIGWGMAAGSYAADLQGWAHDSHLGEEIVVVNPVIEFAAGGGSVCLECRRSDSQRPSGRLAHPDAPSWDSHRRRRPGGRRLVLRAVAEKR